MRLNCAGCESLTERKEMVPFVFDGDTYYYDEVCHRILKAKIRSLLVESLGKLRKMDLREDIP